MTTSAISNMMLKSTQGVSNSGAGAKSAEGAAETPFANVLSREIADRGGPPDVATVEDKGNSESQTPIAGKGRKKASEAKPASDESDRLEEREATEATAAGADILAMVATYAQMTAQANCTDDSAAANAAKELSEDGEIVDLAGGRRKGHTLGQGDELGTASAELADRAVALDEATAASAELALNDASESRTKKNISRSQAKEEAEAQALSSGESADTRARDARFADESAINDSVIDPQAAMRLKNLRSAKEADSSATGGANKAMNNLDQRAAQSISGRTRTDPASANPASTLGANSEARSTGTLTGNVDANTAAAASRTNGTQALDPAMAAARNAGLTLVSSSPNASARNKSADEFDANAEAGVEAGAETGADTSAMNALIDSTSLGLSEDERNRIMSTISATASQPTQVTTVGLKTEGLLTPNSALTKADRDLLNGISNPAASETTNSATGIAQARKPGTDTTFNELIKAADVANTRAQSAEKAQQLSASMTEAKATLAQAETAMKSAASAESAATAPTSTTPLPPAMQFQTATLQAAQAMASANNNSLSPRVGTPDWDQALGQRVAWMVAGGEQSASLTLNPPDLGPLQVVLNVSNAQADAAFFAAQPEVREALEAALPKLRDMLSDAGIQLGQASVSAGTPEQRNMQSDNQSQSGPRQFTSNSNTNRSNDVNDSTSPTPAPRPRANGGSMLVDTFA